MAAYGAHLAVIEREAIEAVPLQWEAREQQLRETQWARHEGAIVEAKRGLDEYIKREKDSANLAFIARMLEFASKLGSLATGLGTDGEWCKGDELPTMRVEVTVARAAAGSRIGCWRRWPPYSMPLLARAGHLKRLGKPGQNAQKWYAMVELERVSRDPAWLDKAIRLVDRLVREANGKPKGKGAEEVFA